jgi:hypothetical protein
MCSSEYRSTPLYIVKAWESSLCMYVQQRIVTTKEMDTSFIFTYATFYF